MMPPKLGLWIIGARGGVATTLVTGALAIRQQLEPAIGMITECPEFCPLELPGLDSWVFGGHDIRSTHLVESALEIHRDTGTLGHTLIAAITEELNATEANIAAGHLYHSGKAIETLASDSHKQLSAKDCLDAIIADISAFQQKHHLDRTVVLNLASTESPLLAHQDHASAAGIQRLVDSDDHLSAASLYALAASRTGCAYINFTPSGGALLPGIRECFDLAALPYAGNDGKTGETLLKAVLAPMFLKRQLQVLSWQGYNMLGDRDGEILADEENKKSKIRSKDRLLHETLGYPVHSKVSIDYVPSLNDWKTAWDFIHFKGFLGTKMSLQLTWQGCDAILAAPIALDMARLAAHALAQGESGPLLHFATFFKSPLDCTTHDFHHQFDSLLSYLKKV